MSREPGKSSSVGLWFHVISFPPLIADVFGPGKILLTSILVLSQVVNHEWTILHKSSSI